jgi:hypothetical protein
MEDLVDMFYSTPQSCFQLDEAIGIIFSTKKAHPQSREWT